MKIYWIWIAFVPFLYLPNFSPTDTGFGVLEISDFFILPLLFLLFIIPGKRLHYLNARAVLFPLLGFLLWCLFGVLMIYLLFDYIEPNKVVFFSLLKIGKFALYSLTPLFIAGRISNESVWQDFHWAYLGCIVFMAISLMLESNYLSGEKIWEKNSMYKSLNLISTSMAILLVYLSALVLEGTGSVYWRRAFKICLLVVLPGFSLTQGRGGWVAALAGFGYLAYQRGLFRYSTFAALIVTVVGLFGLYFQNSDFKHQVDMTLFPELAYDPELDNHVIFGIDDGYRLGEAERQVKYFADFVIFGSGFYHRGGQTHLAGSGSHDFWLQMFLETGFLGGCLILYIFFRMWRQAQSQIAKDYKISVALQSALITAFIGGLSGEYFYGGLGLFSIFLVYAPLGALSIKPKKRVNQFVTELDNSVAV